MLLEREKELELLADLLADVDSSGGKVVLVRGEAGIGKSSLVREFVESHSDDAHVLFGACDDLLIPQPLGPFWDMARLEPTLKEPLDDGDRPRFVGDRSGPPVAIVASQHHGDRGHSLGG